jgi:putative transposase
MNERKAMLTSQPGLSVTRQCQLLAVPRSSAYARAQPVASVDLAFMRLLDELYLKWPFYGSRRLCDALQHRGHRVNRKRVRRLMRQMGLRAIYPKPRTSQAGKGHKIYPYRLRGLLITRPNQVWASDICYIPMVKGFMYLTVIMDWYSRRVLAWRISNTLDTEACVEALEEALGRYGTPEIFNTDQGAQYTSEAFTTVLQAHGVTISMDGKGRWVDNVFVERLWRSVKYEDVYLHAYETPAALRAGLTNYFMFYNTERRHQALTRQTPDAVYFAQTQIEPAA